MKISEGLKLEGRVVEIPDAVRDDLPGFFEEMGFKIGAEIGVYRGRFSQTLARGGFKLYSIDPWLIYPDYHGLTRAKQWIMEEQYEYVKKLLSHYDCTVIRKYSMDAVKDFEDNSLDFVYIDGNHGLKYIIEDIWEWTKKVRKGGVVSGHDYWNGTIPFSCDGKTGVDAYAKAAQLDKLYILGKHHEGTREKCRSWFFIK
jgi:hypothetical protein